MQEVGGSIPPGSTKPPIETCKSEKPCKFNAQSFRCGRFVGTHLWMAFVSKPQGLVRRGNVWHYRRRIPLDLIQSFGGRRELKESLGTSDPSKAKTRRNIVAAK